MLPTGDCVTSEVVCCTSLFDIANHLLTEVYVALLECLPTGDCQGTLAAYVTLGAGDDAVSDGLSVVLSSIGPSPGSVLNNRSNPASIYRAMFVVRLIESGWPLSADMDGNYLYPDPVDQHAAARHAYSHGEKMYRKLASMASSGSLWPTGMACTKGTLLALTPMNPLGGTVGWQAQIEILLPWGLT